MESANKDVKTAIINIPYMFKMKEGNTNIERKDVDFFKTQRELLEMNNTVSEMETVLNEINSRLDTAKEEINDLEDIAIETIKKGAQNNMKVLLPLRN